MLFGWMSFVFSYCTGNVYATYSSVTGFLYFEWCEVLGGNGKKKSKRKKRPTIAYNKETKLLNILEIICALLFLISKKMYSTWRQWFRILDGDGLLSLGCHIGFLRIFYFPVFWFVFISFFGFSSPCRCCLSLSALGLVFHHIFFPFKYPWAPSHCSISISIFHW